MRKISKLLTKKKLSRKERRTIILFLVKLGFKDLTVAEKLVKARAIVGAMTGNTNFTTPNPALATITTAVGALDAAQQAVEADSSKIKITIRDNAEVALNILMNALQSYVDSTAMGDVEVIQSSGMEVRKTPTPATVLDAPTGLTAVSTQIEGEIKLKWDSSGSSKLLYIIEMAQDILPTPTWQSIGESSKATFTAEDLQPGQKYRFRISVANAAGMSGYSTEAACRPN